MSASFKVVDLFAGPGGLAEGFSSLRRQDGSQPFEIAMSVEKEASAHQTLRLRAFLRQFSEFPTEYYAAINRNTAQPNWAQLYPDQWQAAEEEALRLELGIPEHNALLHARIDSLRKTAGANTILIGGPPCQAYSLVGRARNKGTLGYKAEEDHRHFLYREYIAILKRLRPAIFVMENVKGLISSSVSGEGVLERIMQDLRSACGPDSYELIPLMPANGSLVGPEPRDFVIRSENVGVPQARHRVIIVGLRRDLVPRATKSGAIKALPTVAREAKARHVLDGLPKVRSGLSGGNDAETQWRKVVNSAFAKVVKATANGKEIGRVSAAAKDAHKRFKADNESLNRTGTGKPDVANDCDRVLAGWIIDKRIKLAPNHEARGHMESDLARYLFCSIFAMAEGRSPKASDFPDELAPDHANWTSGKFADRFRAQLRDAPSTTVTSHISKDGHYFIHPDPLQCRSLTVREAARLQTFPDNYLFLGNRTQQYVQVGNAVPPFLARRIAEAVLEMVEPATTPTTRKNTRDRAKADA